MSFSVMILMGSPNDWDTMRKTGAELEALGIRWQAHVASAHRSPEHTVALVRRGEAEGVEVFVCGAGLAAHLAGAVAAQTTKPVIGVPLPGGIGDGLDALLSTVQMPGGIPVATVAVGSHGAKNAAWLAAEILALGDAALAARLGEARRVQTEAVLAADRALVGEQG